MRVVKFCPLVVNIYVERLIKVKLFKSSAITNNGIESSGPNKIWISNYN